MQASWFDDITEKESLAIIDGRWVSRQLTAASWSFSHEWKEHASTQQQRTWDMTARQRLEHFYTETKITKEQLPGKLVLDAGCGNGQLTQAIAAAGANVVGIDRQPHLPPGDAHTQFVQSDFDTPPFKPQSFDIIIANGSIHHTPDTFHSFQSLTALVKEGGRLYVWVYKKQKGWQRFLLWWLDVCRFFISRFPASLQRFTVNLLTGFFYYLSRIRKGNNSERSKDEIRINVYDAFTPRYRYYFTPAQVKDWFIKTGFTEVMVTHDNNKYGFGMLGIKNPLPFRSG
jgi:SAM-dependent methyltransferase